jgi:hypothetical protein
MTQRLNFNNRNRGKQPRANIFLRAGRLLRRKRVAYARLAAAHALKQAQREIDRFQTLSVVHRVPIDHMAPLPILPLLPGQLWIDHLQDMGPLKDPVKPAAPAPQQAGATA